MPSELNSITALKEQLRKIYCLREVSELLAWDQETYMPEGGAAARSDQSSVVSELAHELLASPRTAELLEAAQQEITDPQSVEAHLCRKVKHEHLRAVLVPKEIVAQLASATSAAQSVWIKARQNNDFESFRPYLEKVVELTRQTAHYYGYQDHIYDALLEGYEPGMKTAQVSAIFNELRAGLVELVQRIKAAKPVDTSVLQQSYPIEQQRAFCRRIITDMGYDWSRGRTDDVVHPFCCSFSTRDVRITNVFKENEVTRAIFGALHETGHALYEQGSPAEWMHLPIEGGASMGIHESESRLWENIIGRSRAFWTYYFPVLKEYFPQQLAKSNVEEFYRAVNHVTPSFVRTEADEVTYSLHIMLRFELEKALLSGELEVKDLPAAWNSAMQDYLGIVPETYVEGCLQDVHWPIGLFGYFPTYALGNLIGAQTWEALRRELPQIDEQLASGQLSLVREWLQEHIYCWGARLLPAELILQATGQELHATAFLKYLQSKYGAIYGF